jgi:hypothetical protein
MPRQLPADGDPDMLPFVRQFGRARVTAPAGARPLVVLPGFGLCAADYDGLKARQAGRGWHVTVLDVQRMDW